MKNIYLQLLDKFSEDPGLILATVAGTDGSTPQKPGSKALFGKMGLITGTVGGGVVEGKVMELASEAGKSKKSALILFNLGNEISGSEEPICGGRISILLDANLHNSISVFEQIRSSLSNHIPGVLVTMVTKLSGSDVLINRYWFSELYVPELPDEFMDKIRINVDSIISEGNPSDYREMELSISGEEPSSMFFFEPVFPPSHLVIAGAGHIGKALAHFAKILDFEVTIIDDRSEYANAENIPDAEIVMVKDIGNALKKLKKENDTYIVIVTRSHIDDAAALRSVIRTGFSYVGMIGSKTKIAKMRKDFIEKGWATQEEWERIFAPVGLDIKSRTVEEIAVSIVAQLVLVRNSRNQEVKS